MRTPTPPNPARPGGGGRAGTRLLFATEGILLRALASDPQLSSYSVAIVDEVHERHLRRVRGGFVLCFGEEAWGSAQGRGSE